jgi:hypothetical protein
MHLRHRGIRTIPERLKDAKLEVSKAMSGAVHGGNYDQVSTILVVVESTRIFSERKISGNGFQTACGGDRNCFQKEPTAPPTANGQGEF